MATVHPFQSHRVLNQPTIYGVGTSLKMLSAAAPALGARHVGKLATFPAGRVSFSLATRFNSLSLAFSQKCTPALAYNEGDPVLFFARDPRMCNKNHVQRQHYSRVRRKFSVPFLGKSNSGSRLGRKSLLLISSRILYKGLVDTVKTYAVVITSNKFELRQRKFRKLLFKTLKISLSWIHSWLRRKRSVLEVRPGRAFSTAYQWRPTVRKSLRFKSSSLCHKEFNQIVFALFRVAIAGADVFLIQTPRRQDGAKYGVVNCQNSFSSSTQADGNGSVENKTTLLTSGVREREREQLQRIHPDGGRDDFLATGHGWRVRDAEMDEWREIIRVADIQTDAFHEPVAVLDDLFYKIFHTEVLSSLQYKARHSPPNRYSCLLAEKDPLFVGEIPYSEQTIVGAVDVTALANADILCHLPGVDEYLYVSGMAVDSAYRRRNVATLLLEACLARGREWGFTFLVLHAYEDDLTARSLYSKAGYEVIAADPSWLTKFFGRRRRVVMAKEIPLVSDSC